MTVGQQTTTSADQPWQVVIEPWHEPFPWERAVFIWLECIAIGLLAGMFVGLLLR